MKNFLNNRVDNGVELTSSVRFFCELGQSFLQTAFSGSMNNIFFNVGVIMKKGYKDVEWIRMVQEKRKKNLLII
jgi:hypothetical protein